MRPLSLFPRTLLAGLLLSAACTAPQSRLEDATTQPPEATAPAGAWIDTTAPEISSPQPAAEGELLPIQAQHGGAIPPEIRARIEAVKKDIAPIPMPQNPQPRPEGR
jgi:hypothetical protein